ncbi:MULTISPECIES: extracellular solute-binding protein [unclassified Xanthobacter]|uniref:extracellular solute-binding protein n=1 Tax=unclassified Xanthobacter TaxID=2623496 RepID=UPI001EDFB4D3|nr:MULTISPECIES: extracellular solute-binding protein [unclassified Xanthobacter]
MTDTFRLTRRALLAAGAGAALTPAFSASRLMAAEANEVVVGTWGGDFGNTLKMAVDDAIMKPMGYTVLQEISGPVPRRTKILAERMNRRGSLDVACLADFDTYAASAVGALADVTRERVPNSAHVLPFLRKSYAIPQIYSAHTIVYNKEMIPTPPASIQELWNPKYKGKIGLSDFLYTTNMAYAAMANGGSMSDFGPAKKGLEAWKALDAKVLASTEAVGAALKSGEIWMTIIAAARGYMWSQQGIPVGWSIAEEGAFPTTYEACVPKNARNLDGGFVYLNAMLDPSAQTAFSKKMGYLPTVTNAKLDPDLEKLIGFTEAQQQRLWTPDLSYIMKNQAQLLDTWNRDFKG